MSDACSTTVRGFRENKQFKAIQNKDIVLDSVIFPGRFLLSQEYTDDEETKFKAHFVVGVHCGRVTQMMAHTSQSIQSSSKRVSIAVTSDF